MWGTHSVITEPPKERHVSDWVEVVLQGDGRDWK